MRFAIGALLLVSVCAAVWAQSADEFEVTSLKRSAPGEQVVARLDASQFICRNHSLLLFIISAYPDTELQPWKIAGGPSWLTNEYWDFSAKLPPNMPTEQEPLDRKTEQMLRTFLADAFKLKVHRESKEASVYALVGVKGGSKLKPFTGTRFQVTPLSGGGGLEFHHTSMANLISYLYNPWSNRSPIDRPVLDMTGLTGFFDFTLAWRPDGADPSDVGPSIITAFEELGLKLQPQKAPVDFLVIDHAERPVLE